MTKQDWLISYSHPNGFGRFVNPRTDGKAPSFTDIESMEKKVAEANGFKNGSVCVIAISKLQTEE